MNIKERQQIVIAALLHDIGKFWERADEKYDTSENIKEEFPNAQYTHTVPVYSNGYPMYSHALWTQAFLNKFELGEHLGLDTENVSLATLSARHHKPENHLEGIISLADKWSSSIDRPDEGEEGVEGYADVKKNWGTGFNKKIPLHNIFDQIQVGTEKNKSTSISAYKLAKLNVLDNNTIYPTKLEVNENSTLQTQYRELWRSFTSEIVSLKNRSNDFDSFFTSLCDILRNHTWCIPSATNTAPANVSLYEHLKTTAGLALAIYDYHAFHNKEINYKGRLDSNINLEDSLLMVCIDISGIQNFIYDIANKKAAKSLKGRSFFLQILMTNILDNLLNHKDIQGYQTNIIYASGGKSYLILPNLQQTKDALLEVEEQMQNYIWTHFGGKLYIVFGSIAFNYQTTKDENTNQWVNLIRSNDLTEKEKKITDGHAFDLGDLWRLVLERAALGKNKKFLSKVQEYTDLFEPQEYNINAEKCAVTGQKSTDLIDLNDGNDENNRILVLPAIHQQTKLGESLKNSEYLIEYFNPDSFLKAGIEINGIKYQLKDQDYLIRSLPATKFKRAIVNRLNDTEKNILLDNIGVRTLFYGGNKQPLKEDGEFKTFEDLAKTENGQTTKLGILRMDVDNLGQIFINGFDNTVQKKSFAAYSTLSFMLEVFFCGHINHIQQKNEIFQKYVQILYSGGDDLFAIGRWDAIINFAETVRFAFKEFVQRDDITISGGIAIVGAKYPITKAAELAGIMETNAKNHNNKAKNAINFFEETVNWNSEFNHVKDMKNEFIAYDATLNRSFIQNIQKFKLLKDSSLKNGLKDYSYMWQSAYNFSRKLARLKKYSDENAIEFLDSIRSNILHNKQFGAERYLDLLALAARWAEYSLKLNK